MKHIYLVVAIFILANPLFAQLTPEQVVAEMGRGINLGNTLEPPAEGGWNNGPAQESYFDAYSDAGFTNIRVPVRWDEHTADNSPFAIDEDWMGRVEQVVDWGLSRGFYIVLNGHHEDWLKNDYDNATLRTRYDSIWAQVAERFKDKSDSLLFEIINEPKGMTVSEVDDLNERILGIIRKTNPTRNVIYSGNEWANSNELLNAAIPSDDYVIGYYHSYDPWKFCGEANGTWGTTSDYQQVTDKYQAIKNWSAANNIPIYHSEFGALVKCDFNSRMRIYAHNVEQCVVNGFAFSVWDDGGNFKILNRDDNTWPEIKDVIMHYHEDSPNQIFSTIDETSDESSVVVEWNNRAVGNGNIVLERLAGASGDFVQIADLASDVNSYNDVDVDKGKTYTYRMHTTRTDGTLLHGYPTRIKVPSTEQTPFNGTAIAIPGKLEVENYDEGGEGLAYHDTDTGNIPCGYRTDEGVDIAAHDNGFMLGYVVSGEWLEYTVDVAQSGYYSVDADVASEVANGAFSITFDKNNATTSFSTPSTGSWIEFQKITANATIGLEAGEQQMRLKITNSNAFNLDNLIFTQVSTAVNNIDEGPVPIKIYPNPTSGILNIELSEEFRDSPVQIELFKVTGEKIGKYTLEGTSTTIDLGDFESGLYVLHVIGDYSDTVQRIVVD